MQVCKVADVAMTMVNRSIELAQSTGDENYYMDFVKLHKLLYLGQCAMLSTYDQLLFEEQISAHRCGPYVEGIHFVPGTRGFGKITVPFRESEFVFPSYWRQEIIDQVLKSFGTFSTEELIDYTRELEPYRAVEDEITEENKPVISRGLMRQYARQCVT